MIACHFLQQLRYSLCLTAAINHVVDLLLLCLHHIMHPGPLPLLPGGACEHAALQESARDSSRSLKSTAERCVCVMMVQTFHTHV